MEERNSVEDVDRVNFYRQAFLHEREKFLHHSKVVAKHMTHHKVFGIEDHDQSVGRSVLVYQGI